MKIQEIKDKWAGQECFLNGEKAKVTGRLLQFGRISPLNPEIGSVEFCWETIDRIMKKDKKFNS